MNFEFHQKPLRLKAVVIAIIISFLFGAGIILAAGHGPLEVYQKLVVGAFGSLFSFSSTLRWTTPLLFTGVAAAFAFRGGMFNIGVEGQMYIGAFLSALAGIYFSGLPKPIHILICILFGAIGGILWVAVPAFMRVYYGANEMVTTLMMNYVAMYLTDYLVKYHFLAGGAQGSSLVTKEIAESAQLSKLWPNMSAHTGFFLGLFLIVIFGIVMQKTKLGYEIHISGINPAFAYCGGVSVNRVRMSVMIISGAIAGIGGSMEVMGTLYKFMSRFSPDFGFDGLVVALLGGNAPIGVLFSSFFLGAVKAGALQVERATAVSRSLAMIIQGIMVVFISCKATSDLKLPRWLCNRLPSIRRDKAIRKGASK
jgi:ABC-type uncharacterized transport system permease subunit